MSASEFYRNGQLREAISAQIEEVKAAPTDQSLRLFLYELLMFNGELDRARRQIEAIRYNDPDLDAAIIAYRGLINSEQARRNLFTLGQVPEFIGEPAAHLNLRLDAVNLLREGHQDEASELILRANQEMPEIRVTLNGQQFQNFRNADDLFAGVLEVFAHGRYIWLGLEQLRHLTIKPPRYPRDLLFIPVHLETEESEGDIFLPSTYPGTYEHVSDEVKLGRMTEWKDLGESVTMGVGLHTFLHGEDISGILEWRTWSAEGK